jgi:hypothetical protein
MLVLFAYFFKKITEMAEFLDREEENLTAKKSNRGRPLCGQSERRKSIPQLKQNPRRAPIYRKGRNVWFGLHFIMLAAHAVHYREHT